jgi:NADPH-dependent 7-cyano-7-deazaguanine reductase QueF-like protein
LTDFALGIDAPPSTVKITIEAPGIVKKEDLSGKLYLNSFEQGIDHKLPRSLSVEAIESCVSVVLFR